MARFGPFNLNPPRSLREELRFIWRRMAAVRKRASYQLRVDNRVVKADGIASALLRKCPESREESREQANRK